MEYLKKENGQSLVELIIGMAIGAVVIGGVTALIGSNLKSTLDNKITQAASSLAQEMAEQVKSAGEADWHNIYSLAKGPDNKFYIASSTQAITAGTELTIQDGRNFSRYFYIEKVNRDQCGIGDITPNPVTFCSGPGSAGVAEDPSTQRITVIINYGNTQAANNFQYISRTRNISVNQADWAGSFGQDGPITRMNNKFATSSSNVITSSVGAMRLQLP